MRWRESHQLTGRECGIALCGHRGGATTGCVERLGVGGGRRSVLSRSLAAHTQLTHCKSLTHPSHLIASSDGYGRLICGADRQRVTVRALTDSQAMADSD